MPFSPSDHLGQLPTLPSEIVLKIAQCLHHDRQLLTLSALLATSTYIRDLVEPLLYTHLELDKDQLYGLLSAHSAPRTMSSDQGPVQTDGRRDPRALGYTTHLHLSSPLTTRTAALIRHHPRPPPFPSLLTLSICSKVLRNLPQGSSLPSQFSTKGFNHRAGALSSLGPFHTLLISPPPAGDECVFTILSPIIPTSMGLSLFLPVLAKQTPRLKKMVYKGWHADLVYPTEGVETVYERPCGCWLRHGVDRMGLGLRLAWAQEGKLGKGSTKVKVLVPDKGELEKWDRFEEMVLAYMKNVQDMTGRTILRDDREVIDCLEIVLLDDESHHTLRR